METRRGNQGIGRTSDPKRRFAARCGGFFAGGLIGLVRFYQWAISPWFPPCCRFSPSCSHYAIDALKVHGLVRGSLLTIWRLLRCQPFCRGGHDPVPPRSRD